jgi:hypothetical protein
LYADILAISTDLPPPIPNNKSSFDFFNFFWIFLIESGSLLVVNSHLKIIIAHDDQSG